MTTVFERLKEFRKNREENRFSMLHDQPYKICLANLAPDLIAVVEAAQKAVQEAPADIWHFSEIDGKKIGHMPHWLMDLTSALAPFEKEVE